MSFICTYQIVITNLSLYVFTNHHFNEAIKFSLPNCHFFVVTKLSLFSLANCHYKIVTFMFLPVRHYQIVITKLSLPSCHHTKLVLQNCHYQIVVTKLSPYQVGITKLSFPNCHLTKLIFPITKLSPYQVGISQLALPSCHLTKLALPNCHNKIVLSKLTLPKIRLSSLCMS